MREILFRGKKRNGEWIYGCLANFSDEIEIFNATEGKFIDPETVGQYTGLTDKNGRKIFEGDIVKSPDYDGGPHIGTVYIGRYTTISGVNIYGCYIRWQPPEDAYVRPDLYYWTEGWIEVIGNIYDNPELLEVKDE